MDVIGRYAGLVHFIMVKLYIVIYKFYLLGQAFALEGLQLF